MIAVCRLVAKVYEDKHHHICGKVSKRMYGISYHGSRMAEDTCCELHNEQHHIDNAAPDGDSEDFLFPFHIILSLVKAPSSACKALWYIMRSSCHAAPFYSI